MKLQKARACLTITEDPNTDSRQCLAVEEVVGREIARARERVGRALYDIAHVLREGSFDGEKYRALRPRVGSIRELKSVILIGLRYSSAAPNASPPCPACSSHRVSRSRVSSCSPDFGVGGVSDRLGQISPKLVFFSLGYLYSGRWFDCRKLALDVLARLPGACLVGWGGIAMSSVFLVHRNGIYE